MKINHSQAIIFSGTLWFAIGLMLLAKGLNFIIIGGTESDKERWALTLVVGALFMGFLKARFILSKTVSRVTSRITALPNPFPVKQLYPRSYYFIIFSMILLGISMRWIPISLEIRGAIDVAIGSALINGALLYFRTALAKAK